MAVKIAVTPEYEDEKRQFHSNRLLLVLLLKKLTALSDIFFNFWKLCTWLLNKPLRVYVCWHQVRIDLQGLGTSNENLFINNMK